MKRIFLFAALLGACASSPPTAEHPLTVDGAHQIAARDADEALKISQDYENHPFWNCFTASPDGPARKKELPASAKIRLKARTDAQGRVVRCWALHEGGNFDKRVVDACLQRVLPGAKVATDEAASTFVDIRMDFDATGYRYELLGSDQVKVTGHKHW